MENNLQPSTHRYVFLDALRGFALLGICMANFPEFSLYTFQPDIVVESMPTAWIDKICKWLMLVFVDGKFYTIFSLLFGMGFSLILSNLAQCLLSSVWLKFFRFGPLEWIWRMLTYGSYIDIRQSK